jgi:aminoglycoside phosphotransferase (APT) family kinase protein
MAYIQGETLIDFLNKSNDKERKIMARKVGKVLRAIHEPAPFDVNPQSYLDQFLSRTEEKLALKNTPFSKLSFTSKEIVQKIRAYISLDKAISPSIVWVHRDFSLRNILIERRTNQIYVIDWEESGWGLAYEDMLIVIRFEELFPEILDSFWEGYGKRLDMMTVKGFVLGILSQLLATADRQFLDKMSTIAGVDIQKSFGSSIILLMQA